ncbi:ATP synthase epsilon chain, sodium ion specific [Poriferisphaera corsica]|uniref:ATP synthase epsilon chain n=1 Tax=Poriferisphaera corsica TaxID=2528020 RepID=A0A517YUQ7_9BACT|nr:F0F1 ATP synthase subunit epsilon [Poriferisphaera corsica]QDU33958.1 ATP synthase epsilon chain, sodium ion specific [Poriferisphaera corsica]
MASKATFQCTLVTPGAAILDEKIVYASIPAHDGKIGVEHLQAPMLIKLGYGHLRLDLADGSSDSYFIGGGFVQVKDDVLSIITDEATLATELTVTEAEQQLESLLAEEAKTGAELDEHDKSVQRARARVAVAKTN